MERRRACAEIESAVLDHIGELLLARDITYTEWIMILHNLMGKAVRSSIEGEWNEAAEPAQSS